MASIDQATGDYSWAAVAPRVEDAVLEVWFSLKAGGMRTSKDLVRDLDHVRATRVERVSPRISGTGFEATFAWFDTPGETRQLLDWLEAAAQGEVFSDVDQGWMIEILLVEGALAIRECDPDDPDHWDQTAVIPYEHLRQQVPEVRARVELVLGRHL